MGVNRLPVAFAAVASLVSMAACSGAPPRLTEAEHRAATDAWFAARLEALQREDGWLTLTGLHWIPEGTSTFGPGDDNDLVVAMPSASARLGTLERRGAQVVLTALPGSGLTIDGEPVDELALVSDLDPDVEPTLVRSGTASFFLIARGERLALRVRDSQSPTRLGFAGLDRYPVDLDWRFDARFEQAPTGTTIPVPNITGDVFDEPSPGSVVFERDGVQFRLRAIEGDRRLFLVFGDATNGDETYGSGRFLYADPPDAKGRVVVDFNRAYNPPCVFTEWATCPLPPAGNRLPFPVRAGELAYAHAVH